MSKKQILIDLAKRCEAAEKEDRRLEYEIMTATAIEGQAYLWDPKGRDHRYLSSFDHAFSLVPTDYDWIVADVNGYHGGTSYACVGSKVEHFGDNPINALCNAALMARADLELEE